LEIEHSVYLYPLSLARAQSLEGIDYPREQEKQGNDVTGSQKPKAAVVLAWQVRALRYEEADKNAQDGQRGRCSSLGHSPPVILTLTASIGKF